MPRFPFSAPGRAAAVVLGVTALVTAGCRAPDNTTAAAPATTAAPVTTPAAAADVPPTGPGSGGRLVIQTFLFRPHPLEAKVGEVIVVENRDDILHTATSGADRRPDGRFRHELNGPGSRAELRYDQPGTYEVFCEIHTGMRAEVQVR